MNATILVVEDEKPISTLIQYNLEKEIDYSPFYAFKCHTYMPILFLFPQ